MGRIVRSPRLAARRRAVRAANRKQRRRVVASLVLIGAATYGGIAMTRSQLFGLAEIEVVGARSVAERAVIGATGLSLGENTIGIDLEEVATRLRSAFPQIQDARVSRAGSLGVRIEIVERAGVVELRSGSRITLLDENGLPASTRAAKRLPILALDGGATHLREAVAGVTEIWRAMPDAMRKRVDRFTFRPPATISFAYRGSTVLIGTPDEIGMKLQTLELVRDRVRQARKRLVSVDLRAPAHPAAKIR